MQHLLRIKDTDFTDCDAMDFVLHNDIEGMFERVKRIKLENFVSHFERLYEANQIFILEKNLKINGLVTWLYVTEESAREVGKFDLRLPDNISTGDTIQVSTCILLNKGDMPEVVKAFKKEAEKKGVTKARWFSHSRKKFFYHDRGGIK